MTTGSQPANDGVAGPSEPSPFADRGANPQSIALLVFAVLGIIGGVAFMAIGSQAASQPITLENIGAGAANLGAGLRDQVTGAAILMLGVVSFLLWLAVGAVRREL